MKMGWQKKTLGDVLVKTETTDPARSPQTEFDYIDVSSVSNETLAIEETQRLNGKDAPSRARRLVKANDVLFATIRPTLRRIAIVSEELDNQVCSTGYFVLRAKSDVDHRFVFYFLQTEGFMTAIEKLQRGASYPAVTDGDVRSQQIPIPPLPEQHRIVRILDQAFEGIARATANAEQNLRNARAFFESHLQSVFTQRGERWVERPLGTLATFRNGINYTKESKGERVKVVGVRNFQKHFSAPLDDLDTVTIDGKLSELDSLKKDDILAVRSNGNIQLIGRCILVGEVTEKISHSGFTIRIRLSDGIVIPKYICHFMKSAGSRKLLTEGGTGTNIKSLNQGMLSALMIPFPPVPVQKSLVEQLESISEKTQRLESIYRQKLAALGELKKSLLHQAFNGDL
jgi:type I restriction enzyme S subunit